MSPQGATTGALYRHSSARPDDRHVIADPEKAAMMDAELGLGAAEATVCPTARDGDEEVARRWVSESLSANEAREFEAHLRTCKVCQRAVEHASEVTAALRTAAASHAVSRPIPGWWWVAVTAIVGATAIAVWTTVSS
jgi:hypothetical protein